MTEPTTNQLIYNVLQSAVQLANKTGVWLGGQIPDVLHQLLEYNLIMAIIGAIVGLLIVMAGFVIIWAIYRKFTSSQYRMDADDWGGFTLVSLIPFGLLVAPGLAMFFCNLSNMIEIWVAPKIYCIQYAASLIQHR